jgi:glucan phosphoethanolaminetransferase (alkaline phosphatase superfamily)
MRDGSGGSRWPTWIPLAWTLALVAGVALLRGSLAQTGASLPRAEALPFELGFWALFFAAARGLQRRVRLGLLATGPIFAGVLALAAAQEAHRALYGTRFTVGQVGRVSENWEVVSGAVLGFLGQVPAGALAGALLALLAAFALALARSRAPVYRPLAGAGGLYAAASAAWAVWAVWATASPLHVPVSPDSPALAAHALAVEIRLAVQKEAARTRKHALPWGIARTGVRPVPAVPDAGGAPRPDVFLLLLESVRADHLSVYGYERDTTPRLREWATRPDVRVFPRAFANASASYLSMISLTSGLDLRRGRAEFAETPLVWDRLAARGYQSCLVTISLGYPRMQLDRFLATPGLSHYRDLGQEQIASGGLRTPDGLRGIFLRGVLGETTFRSLGVDRDDRRGFEAFRDCLARRDPARPLFGLWELESTHFPYRYPAEFRRFEPASSYAFSPRDPAPIVNDYHNAIGFMDHLIGELLDGLEASGRADDAVVIVASDHGEAFYEHGQLFHGGGLHPEQTRVPLLVRVPEALRGRYPHAALAALEANRVRPVQLADLVPTLVALADASLGAPDSRETDGANLLRALPPNREIHLVNRPPFHPRAQEPQHHAVIRGEALEIASGNGGVERIALAELDAPAGQGAAPVRRKRHRRP